MKLQHLQSIQNKAKYAIVAGRNGYLYTSRQRGIAPIMDMIEKEPFFFHDCIVVDAIIGKAAAMMLTRAKAAYLHGVVMSVSAHEYLTSQNIPHSYDELTDRIINRTGDDICPMEKTVLEITDLQEAYTALSRTLKQLRKA